MSIYIMTDELYHHGVKGQKWGVRKAEKYASKAEKWGRKENKARTGFGKRYAIVRKNAYAYSAQRQKALNNSKGVKEKLRNVYGAEAKALDLEYGGKARKEIASTYKSDKKRATFERQAYNSQNLARHYRNVANHSPSTIKRAKFHASHVMKTPMKNVRSGKDTTYGKEYTKVLLVSAGMTLAQSAASMYVQNKMG